MYCSKCGNSVSDTDKFCDKCGARLHDEKLKCPNCGKELIENAKFCTYCGNKTVCSENQTIADNLGSLDQNTSGISNSTTNDKLSKFDNFLNLFKNKKIIVICGVIFILLVGIFSFKLMNPSKSRTVMIYMVGSNLETDIGLATVDLSALDYEKISSHKMKVVLMAGGTTAWKNNYIDVNKTSIYELTKNGFVEVDSRDITNMGSSDNLSYYLNYVHKNYKSNKYDFIYWNHGGAVDGSEYDDFYSDNLKLVDMKKGFENSPFKEKNKLEIVSFRTCLNSTIEVANIYQDFAEYLVASEEVTRGSVFGSALEFFFDVNDTDNAVEFGKKQIENYKNTITAVCNYQNKTDLEENYCLDSTYSVVDLDKVEPIKSSLDKFSADLHDKINQSYNDMAKIRSNVRQYGDDSLVYDMIDLYDLSNKFSSYSKDNATKLQNAIGSAVVYNWSTNDFSHGLSVYFPYNGDIFLKTYGDYSASKNYNNLISDFSNLKKNTSSTVFADFSSKNNVDVKNNTKESADVEIKLTDEQAKNFAKARYFVFSDNKDGYYNVLYRGNTVKLENNTLKVDVKGKMLRIADSDYLEDSEWIRGFEKEVTDSYTDIVGMFILRNHLYDMHLVNAEIRIDKEHPNGYIKNIYFNDESSSNLNNQFSTFSPVNVSLDDYKYLESVSSAYKVVDEQGNYNPNWSDENNGVIQGHYFSTDQFKLIKEDFSADYDYYVAVQIWDTANNTYFSNIVKIGAE